jgi:hypothetical protein
MYNENLELVKSGEGEGRINALSKNGQFLIMCEGDRKPQLFSINQKGDCKKIKEFEAENEINRLIFLNEDKWILVEKKIYDLATGNQLYQIENPYTSRGYEAFTGLAVSSDKARLLIEINGYYAVRITDFAKNEVVFVAEMKSMIKSACIHPQNKSFMLGFGDGIIQEYYLPE